MALNLLLLKVGVPVWSHIDWLGIGFKVYVMVCWPRWREELRCEEEGGVVVEKTTNGRWDGGVGSNWAMLVDLYVEKGCNSLGGKQSAHLAVVNLCWAGILTSVDSDGLAMVHK